MRATAHHIFADDVQLFYLFERNRLHQSVFKVNQDLYAVSCWACENFLSLNAKKSQAIVFSELSETLLNTHLFPRIVLDGVVIPYMDEVLNLGVLMDKKLSFRGQVNEVCSKVFSRLRSLWPNGHLFSTKTRLVLVKTLIVPVSVFVSSTD